MSDRHAPAAPDLRARLTAALTGRRPRTLRDVRGGTRAAVALILRGGHARAEALFVRRAETPGDPWAGHIALPGGRVEPDDADLLDTARRETREETSLDLPRGAFLGRLDDVRPVSRHLPIVAVRPFVAWLDGEARVREGAELSGHLWVPVNALRDPARRTTRVRPGPPSRVYPAIAAGNDAIWGLTLRIVEDFLARLGEAGG